MTSTSAPNGRSLALRYRPTSFATLTGQRHVVGVLGLAIAADNVPQQLLFSGSSGLGKTTVARIIAAAVMCSTPQTDRKAGDACGTCESCLDILVLDRHHPDVVELDAASHGGKDEIRDLAGRTALAPMRGPHRIVIVDEAHGITGPGGQAFLKQLEEPPVYGKTENGTIGRCIFMLCTTDPDKMLKTNRGRCTEFELLRPSDDELVANLTRIATAEGWVLADNVARAVLAATDDDLGVRGTVMCLEKLAGALNEGVTLDDAALVALLGTAPAGPLLDLTAALEAFDRPAAFAALENLRAATSEDVLRRSLLDWARSGFLAAARAGTNVDAAAFRYRELTAAPQGEAWTELTVARLASPHLDPTPEAVAALLCSAEDRIAAMTATIRDAPAAPPAAAPGPQPITPASTPAGPAADVAPPPTPAGPAPSDAPAPAPAARRPSRPAAAPADANVDRFLAEVTTRKRRVAAMLRSCTMTVDGTVLTISHNAPMTGPLNTELTMLTDAAVQVGLSITLTAQ